MVRLRGMWWLWISLVVGAFALIFGRMPEALGQGATPQAGVDISAASSPDWRLVVYGIQDPYAGVLSNPREPAPGTRYVGADVEVINESNQPLTYAANSVYLRDDRGFAYRAGSVAGGEPAEPALQARTLQGGERARGWVWFGVPEGAALTEIVLVASAPELRLGLGEVARIPGTPRPTATATPGVTPLPTATATPPATPTATPRPTQPPAATPSTNSIVITPPAATPEAIVTGAVEATSTPVATVTATGVPGGIGPGSTVISGIADANLRAGPALSTQVVATLPLGTELTVTGPSVVGDDIIWWPVTVLATGQAGYVAEDLLTVLDEA